MTDRTVSVGLDANISGYLAKMAAAGLSTKGLGSALSDVNDKILHGETSTKKLGAAFDGVVSGQMAVAGAAIVAAGAIVKFAKDGIDHYVALADEVRQFERVTGASAEQSSIMIERAKVLGVNTDSLATSMFRLSQNVEVNKKQLAAHGVEIARNANGTVNLVGTFDNLAAAYRRAGAGQEANRITQLALSRGAIQLLPLLNATREQLKEIDAAAREHHMILDDQDLKNALQYKIALHEMHDSWVGIEQELAKGVLPLITTMVDDVTQIIEGLDKAAHIKLPNVKIGPIQTPRNIGEWAGDLEKLGLASVGIDLFGKHNKGAKDAAVAEEKLKAQIDANNQAVKDYKDALDQTFASTFDLTSATDKFEIGLAGAYTQVKKLKDAGDAYATSLSASTTTGLANRAMLQGLEGDLDAAAKKYKELHPEATDAEIHKALSAQIGQLQTLLTYFSGDTAEAQKLRDMLDQIAGTDLSKPGKTYRVGWGLGFSITNPFGGSGGAPVPPPPVDTTPPSTKDANAFANYLKALFDERMQIIKNEFHEGRATLAQYEHSLDEQMAREKPWTDKWVALQQEKADAVHYWTDAAAKYLTAYAQQQQQIKDHQQQLEDNEYAVGVLGKDRYLEILQQRLAGLEKYSDAWMQVWREIQQIEGNALDAQLKMIQAYDQGRRFQEAWDALAGQRALSGSRGLMSPVQQPTVAVTVVQAGTTFAPILNAYGADSASSSATNMQKMRDLASSYL